MRSNEKMSEDILEKISSIEQRKKQQKKIATKTIGSFFAFALVLFIGFSLFGNNATLPPVTESTNTQESSASKSADKTFSIIVANAAENNDEIKLHKESSISIPLGGILFVNDTKNMSSEEISFLYYQVKCRLQELYGREKGWHITGKDDDAIAVYFGTMDYLKLNISDADAIDNVTLTCEKNGKLTVDDKSLIGLSLKEYIHTVKTGNEITITGEEYKTLYAKNDGLVFYWTPSDELHESFKNAPDTPLSTVTDTITGTITYTDGTEETFTITLSFDDNGILTTTYNYNS